MAHTLTAKKASELGSITLTGDIHEEVESHNGVMDHMLYLVGNDHKNKDPDDGIFARINLTSSKIVSLIYIF
ncbi:hypothetical protein Taro_017817 [Colocasia esculenta]|uniref:Uncharacterized protein n=1 Tax=Colocasia esculenta TaxID=4460 RepID=A0A843US47_COLES|nr:hypothetical protein [Colocasia esculenta]